MLGQNHLLSCPRDHRRDSRSQDAPELEQSSQAPQPVPSSEGLEVPLEDTSELDTSTGSALTIPDDTSKEAVGQHKADAFLKQTRRKWLIIIISLVAVTVVALGVGLGVGLRQQQSSTSTPSGTAGPSQAPIKPLILEDTSLAAAVDSDGDQHVFFQDINGTLRHRMYSLTLNEWIPSIDTLSTGRQPRMHTPISAIDLSRDFNSKSLAVYYIDNRNTLASYEWCTTSVACPQGRWVNNSFPVLPESRSLGSAIMPINASNTDGLLPLNYSSINYTEPFVFYESPDNNVSVLAGQKSYLSIERPDNSNIWQNVSELFYERILLTSSGRDLNNWIGAPFVVYNTTGGPGGLFMNPRLVYDSTAPALFGWYVMNDVFVTNHSALNSFASGATSLGVNPKSLSALSDGESDLAGVDGSLCFVSNKSLICDSFGSSPSPFPFGRLAVIENGNSAYIFHQINESMLQVETLAINLGPSGWGKPTAIDFTSG